MNLDEEVRRGYTIPVEMKKVWQVQLTLLKKLLDVCSKHGLRIWGDGGTMLGTVRENGYIPWDDDIDLVLLRPDYDRLVQIAPSEFKHPFFFQCAYTDRNYVNGHSQLRMDGTAAILPGHVAAGARFHMGIFIDVFPYDAVPDDEQELNSLLHRRSVLLRRMQHIAAGWDIIHPFSSIKYLLRRSTLRDTFNEYEDLFRSYRIEDNQNVSCLSFQIDLHHFLRNKHWYDETVFLPFEGIQMPLPKGYDDILSLQYGDYMTPRKAPSYHGGFLFISADKSYQDYLEENKGCIRKLRLEKIRDRIKRLLRVKK